MIEDIKKTLWATADKLRANMDAAEYKHVVLGLIFVKYISDTFQTRRDELTTRFTDAEDSYFIPDAGASMVAEELEDRVYYREVNVQANIRTLASLRDTLLPRLISGQLRLPEAEALVGEAAA